MPPNVVGEGLRRQIFTHRQFQIQSVEDSQTRRNQKTVRETPEIQLPLENFKVRFLLLIFNFDFVNVPTIRIPGAAKRWSRGDRNPVAPLNLKFFCNWSFDI